MKEMNEMKEMKEMEMKKCQSTQGHWQHKQRHHSFHIFHFFHSSFGDKVDFVAFLRHHGECPDQIDNGEDDESAKNPCNDFLTLFFLFLSVSFTLCIYFLAHNTLSLNEK